MPKSAGSISGSRDDCGADAAARFGAVSGKGGVDETLGTRSGVPMSVPDAGPDVAVEGSGGGRELPVTMALRPGGGGFDGRAFEDGARDEGGRTRGSVSSEMTIESLRSSEDSSFLRATPPAICTVPVSTGGGRVTAFFSMGPTPGATSGGAAPEARGGRLGAPGAEPSKRSVARVGSVFVRSAAVGIGGVCARLVGALGCSPMRGTPSIVGTVRPLAAAAETACAFGGADAPAASRCVSGGVGTGALGSFGLDGTARFKASEPDMRCEIGPREALGGWLAPEGLAPMGGNGGVTPGRGVSERGVGERGAVDMPLPAAAGGRADGGGPMGPGVATRTGAGTYLGGGGGSVPFRRDDEAGPSNALCAATTKSGGGGMLGTMPEEAAMALVESSGTSWAGFQSIHPLRHTGALGAMIPFASAAKSSSPRIVRCWPCGSAQRHSVSPLTPAEHINKWEN